MKILRGVSLIFMLLVGGVCVVAVCLPVFADTDFGLPVNDDKQMATINTVATLASFVVVTLAGIVAIVAYRLASGLPELSFDIKFDSSEVDAPRFVVSQSGAPGRLDVAYSKQVEGILTVRNGSKFAARHPGVRIHFHDIANIQGQPGWSAIETTPEIGISEMQWDGGSDFLIHGEWSRPLRLHLYGTQILVGEGHNPRMDVTLVADGVSPTRRAIPIQWDELPGPTSGS